MLRATTLPNVRFPPIAVLNRLDARSDRAERIGEPALRLAANWDAYLAALAEDRTADVQAMLAPPPLEIDDEDGILGQGGDSMLIHQLHQLRQGKALDEEEFETDDERVWIGDHSWRTSFPPPDDFNGYENGCYGDLDYSRQCTPEERELLDRRYPDAFPDEEDLRKADETERDSYIAALAESLPSEAGEGDQP